PFPRRRAARAALRRHLKPLADSSNPAPKWQSERMRAWSQIGLAQLDQGALAQALVSFARALKKFERLETSVTPPHADALVGLGRVHMAQGDTAKALPLF